MNEKIQKINSYLKKQFEAFFTQSEIQVAWGFPEFNIYLKQQIGQLLTQLHITVSMISDDFTARGNTTNLEDNQKIEFTEVRGYVIKLIRKEIETFNNLLFSKRFFYALEDKDPQNLDESQKAEEVNA